MQDYKTVTYNDLPKYGINPLTGEACKYNIRILCDLSQEGVDLIEDYFGILTDENSAKNWNSQVRDKPAVQSIMLSRPVLNDIRKFILVHVLHYPIVLLDSEGGITGLTTEYYEKNEYWIKECLGYKIERYSVNATNDDSGGRNTHAMTGRTV